MINEQTLKYDLLKTCGGDFDKAQKAFEWIMGTSEESPSVQETCDEFDYIGDSHEGFALVKLNGKYNFINGESEYLSITWFDDAWNFCEGIALVKLNDKWNFINGEGKILSDTWFDYAWGFGNGFARVELGGEEFYIDKQGKRIQ